MSEKNRLILFQLVFLVFPTSSGGGILGEKITKQFMFAKEFPKMPIYYSKINFWHQKPQK